MSFKSKSKNEYEINELNYQEKYTSIACIELNVGLSVSFVLNKIFYYLDEKSIYV